MLHVLPLPTLVFTDTAIYFLNWSHMESAVQRSEKQARQLNISIWKASSAISANSTVVDSTHTTIMPSSLDNLLLNSNTSFLYTGTVSVLQHVQIVMAAIVQIAETPLRMKKSGTKLLKRTYSFRAFIAD